MVNGCAECLDKQRAIDRLKDENGRLKQRLRYRERKQQEGFFGSSTPSAKKPVKPNTECSKVEKKRGAKKGHKAHCRQNPGTVDADRVVPVPSDFGNRCPDCSGPLRRKDTRQRLVRECRPIKSEEVVLELPVERCESCRRDWHTRAPSVFPKMLLGNQLLTNAVEMMYLHGIPMGRVCEQLQVSPGALVGALHRLRGIFSEVPKKLIDEYREAPVKHADETGWRTRGRNGYAWLFATPNLSIFQFEKTRSSRVPKAVFGDQPLPGVLLVDRYAGYNKMPCAIQYCLAHLLRDVQDAEKEFPDNEEVKSFVSTVAPLLALAMGLRSQSISDKVFLREASKLKSQIKKAMAGEAQHVAIHRLQAIFTENEERLYHWVEDRNVPADNNLAERDLRPTVIARKTSFGSQSDAGAKTRGTLMTVFHSLKKRTKNPAVHFKEALDILARNPDQDPFQILFPKLHPA